MGFDTECDLIVEAVAGRAGAPRLRERILHVRNDLLAEHLAVSVPAVEAAIAAADGSLVAAIDGLLGSGRSLVPYQPDEPAAYEELLAENDLLDPERPPSAGSRLRDLLSFRSGHMR